MRKDVRLGFAVSGILLAVIIVAVLVIHRNHTSNKTVAFDTGGHQDASTDAAAPADSSARTDAGASTAAPGAASSGQDSSASSNTDADAHPAPTADAADKTATRWDALFASTAQDPMKPQLTSTPTKPHKSEASSKHDAPAVDAPQSVANSQIDSGSQNVTARSSNSATVDLASGSGSPSSDSAPRTHRVAAGETFVSIARMVYGDGRYYKAIQEANPTLTPEKLKPGIIIQLPPESKVKQAAARSAKSSSGDSPAANAPAISSDGKSYTVQKDDSLYKIARKLYGKGDRSDEIYQLNKQTIGPDSTRLKIGMVLKLPEAVSSKSATKTN